MPSQAQQWAICCNGLSMRQGGLIGALLLRLAIIGLKIKTNNVYVLAIFRHV